MKKLWKCLLPAVGLAFLLVMTAACGDNGGGAEPTPSPPPAAEATPTPAPTNGGGAVVVDPVGPPPRDLGGIEIQIANWWTDYDTDTYEAASFAAQERLDDRIYLERRHNFRIREVRVGDWSDVQDMYLMRFIMGDRDYHVWTLAPDWHALIAQRQLTAPIPQTWFTEGYGGQMTWPQGSMDFAAMHAEDGYTFGWTQAGGGVPMTGGIVFNKRLFEEAGLPRDYLFTLQREGRWNWDAFNRVAEQLTRDPENTGATTTWAHTGFHQEFLARAVFSNNATFVDFCQDQQMLINTTLQPEFMEALEWVFYIRDRGWVTHEMDLGLTDADWDFFVEHFNNGGGAMRTLIHDHAVSQVAPNLMDDWGYVAFPMGPRANNHYTFSAGGNIMAIPNAFSAEEVDVIMYAVMLWNRPLADEDEVDDDEWMIEQFLNFPDPRSVEETMVRYTRNPALQNFSWHEVLPAGDGHWRRMFAWRVWGDRDAYPDASTILEMAQLEWDDVILQSNEIMGFIR